MHFSTDKMYFTCLTTKVNPFWLTTASCISHYIHVTFSWMLIDSTLNEKVRLVVISLSPLSDWFPNVRPISNAPFPSDQWLPAGQYERVDSTEETTESVSSWSDFVQIQSWSWAGRGIGPGLTTIDKQVSFFDCYKRIFPGELLLCEEYIWMLGLDKQIKFQTRFEVYIVKN